MKTTIWVVMGSTGEYSDRAEWFVCAYRDQKTAERHADVATARAKELFDSVTSRYDIDIDQLHSWMGDLDPVCSSMDYTGTNYIALPVELRRTPRESAK